MNKKQVEKLELGLYKIFWKSGGESLAAVGNDAKGNRWLAPCNWINVPTITYWRHVQKVEKIQSP